MAVPSQVTMSSLVLAFTVVLPFVAAFQFPMQLAGHPKRPQTLGHQRQLCCPMQQILPRGARGGRTTRTRALMGFGIGEGGAEEGETEVEKLNRLLEEKTVESRRRQDVEREARERRREERRERLGVGVGAKQSMRNVDPEMIQLNDDMDDLWRLLPKSVTDKYALEKPLGKGSFGSVLLARDKESVDTKVAIKIVRAKPGEEPIIMREGIVLSLIDSPWVPSCFDYGITDNHFCYFVLSFVPGTTLDLVEGKESGLSRGQLPWPQVSQVAVEVLEGLIAVHAAGFLHRDIKPSNIVRCDPVGAHRIIDFGTATGADGCLFGNFEADDDNLCCLRSPGEDTVKTFQAIFDSVDTDGSGYLDEEELSKCYEAVGVRPDREQLASLWGKYDGIVDGKRHRDGRISFEEFVVMFGELVRVQDDAFPPGTHGYIAPEMYTSGGLDRGAASDLFSLGATLYKLTTGQLPYDAGRFTGSLYVDGMPRNKKTVLNPKMAAIEAERERWRRVVADERAPPPPDMSKYTASSLPEGFCQAVMRLLERDTSRRYASAEQAQRAFLEVLAGVGASKV